MVKIPACGLLILACALMCSGCFLAPTIDSVSRAGVTRGDRERLLPEAVKNFHDLLYWDKKGEALSMVASSSREEFRQQFRQQNRQERIVETKVDFAEFGDGAFSAEVDLITKYYSAPVLVVQERREHEKWDFSFAAGGWKIVSREIVNGP